LLTLKKVVLKGCIDAFEEGKDLFTDFSGFSFTVKLALGYCVATSR